MQSVSVFEFWCIKGKVQYSPRLMIYTFGDEIHAKSWWYAIAFTMDKKSTSQSLSNFLVQGGRLCFLQRVSTSLLLASWQRLSLDLRTQFANALHLQRCLRNHPLSQKNKKDTRCVLFVFGAGGGIRNPRLPCCRKPIKPRSNIRLFSWTTATP